MLKIEFEQSKQIHAVGLLLGHCKWLITVINDNVFN